MGNFSYNFFNPVSLLVLSFPGNHDISISPDPFFTFLLEVYLLYETSCETAEMMDKILKSGSRTSKKDVLLVRSE